YRGLYTFTAYSRKRNDSKSQGLILFLIVSLSIYSMLYYIIIYYPIIYIINMYTITKYIMCTNNVFMFIHILFKNKAVNVKYSRTGNILNYLITRYISYFLTHNNLGTSFTMFLIL
ncbi:hypothetical protein ACJX0J_017269, partial [Zea mays]